jgi:hypothetical protein
MDAMKKTLLACAIGVALAQSGLVQAEENWMWRIRAIHVLRIPVLVLFPVWMRAANRPEPDFDLFH